MYLFFLFFSLKINNFVLNICIGVKNPLKTIRLGKVIKKNVQPLKTEMESLQGKKKMMVDTFLAAKMKNTLTLFPEISVIHIYQNKIGTSTRPPSTKNK